MPDRNFVERAVEAADLNALRMALYQVTRDAEIAAITPERVYGAVADTVEFTEADRTLIRSKAVDYLLAGPVSEDALPEPSRAEITELIRMAEARELGPDDLKMRHHIPAFATVPHRAHWTAGPKIPEGFTVAIIGAGFAGIAMGMQLTLLGIPFTIYERRAEVGGVWSINTYPDVRVDTLSITYEYGFEKKYPWTEYFGRQSDVRAYLEHVACKHGVHEHISFGSDVTEARYDDQTKHWTLSVQSHTGATTRVEANVVVAASGVFATPRDLPVEGVEDFAGEIVHTAAWHTGIQYAGKKVAIIGNGSTGVQLLSKVAAEADSVTVYQRTPQWISPRSNYGASIPEELRWLSQTMPFYWNWDKYVAGLSTIDLRNVLMPDEQWIADGGQVSKRNDDLRKLLIGYIGQQVGGDQRLVEQLVPDYAPMTRRPVVDNDWYASLTRDNVDLVTTGIEKLTETEVVSADGVSRETELIIAAVGFQTEKYLWPTEYYGVDGLSLEDAWTAQGAQAHLGMTVPGFPNLFMLYGPNSQPVASGSGLPTWFEIWTRYIADGIVGMLEDGRSAMEIRKDAFDQYNEQLQKEAQKLIYLSEQGAMKKNYYVNEFGRLQFNAPWNGEDYFAMCEAVQKEHFDYSDA